MDNSQGDADAIQGSGEADWGGSGFFTVPTAAQPVGFTSNQQVPDPEPAISLFADTTTRQSAVGNEAAVVRMSAMESLAKRAAAAEALQHRTSQREDLQAEAAAPEAAAPEIPKPQIPVTQEPAPAAPAADARESQEAQSAASQTELSRDADSLVMHALAGELANDLATLFGGRPTEEELDLLSRRSGVNLVEIGGAVDGFTVPPWPDLVKMLLHLGVGDDDLLYWEKYRSHPYQPAAGMRIEVDQLKDDSWQRNFALPAQLPTRSSSGGLRWLIRLGVAAAVVGILVWGWTRLRATGLLASEPQATADPEVNTTTVPDPAAETDANGTGAEESDSLGAEGDLAADPVEDAAGSDESSFTGDTPDGDEPVPTVTVTKPPAPTTVSTAEMVVQNKWAKGSDVFVEAKGSQFLRKWPVQVCEDDGCRVEGSGQLVTGFKLTATCWVRGSEAINFTEDPGAEDNPNAISSTRWYYVEGAFPAKLSGYVPEVFVAPQFRGGAKLKQCVIQPDIP